MLPALGRYLPKSGGFPTIAAANCGRVPSAAWQVARIGARCGGADDVKQAGAGAIDSSEAGSRGYRWRFADCLLDGRTLELKLRGQLVKLEPKVIELLMFLLRHPGEVVTKDELQDALWPGRILSESVLTKAVAKLRLGLGDDDQGIVKTVHGYGYRLIAPVVVEATAGAAPSALQLDIQAGDAPPLRPLWKLVSRLGSGGYGDVWLAEHAKTRDRRVFKFARDAAGLIALKREITLYRLLHQTYGERRDFVAVLDWNLEETPYFIESDYVSGGSLLQWADARGGLAALPLPQRLELVAQAAGALAAAHAAGVLHKDLKPANLLVAQTADQPPQIKLGDFGSGVVLDLAGLARLEITRLGYTGTRELRDGRDGTPLYLAPELLVGQQPTAQSDIYALGVILYQMVVADARRPVAPGWEQDVADELLREDIGAAAAGNPALRLRDAGELASRLRTLDLRRAGLQAQRQSQAEAESLRAALERSRSRRYLQRAVFAMLLLGLVFSSWGFWRARQEQQKAQIAAAEARAAVEFVSEDVLAATDPFGGGRPKLSIKALLDEAAPRMAQRLAAHPKARAEMGLAIGSAYQGLGDWIRAQQQLEAALQDSTAALGAVSDLSLRIADRLAHVALLQSHYDEAERIYRSIYQRRRERFGERHADTLSTRDGMAWLEFERGHFQRAAGLYEQLVADYQGVDAAGRTGAQWSLADCYLELNRNAEAEALARGVIAATIQLQGSDHPSVQWQTTTLGDALMTQGRWDEAAMLFDRAYAGLLKSVGELHPYTLTALHYRGQLLLERGDPVAALPLLRRVHDARSQIHGADHVWTRYSANRVGEALTQLGLAKEALPILERAYQQGGGAQGWGHPNVLLIRRTLADTLIALGDYTRADELLQQGIALASTSLPPNNVRLAYLHQSLGHLRRLQRREPEARGEYTAAQTILVAALGASHPAVLQNMARLGP